jgi:hypothetical protein
LPARVHGAPRARRFRLSRGGGGGGASLARLRLRPSSPKPSSSPHQSLPDIMASETKGLFRSLTRSKSKKKPDSSSSSHGHSSSADGHQPPSLAAWGQANSAAGAGLAGVGGIGAGGVGRAATLREKTRAQMGGLVPAATATAAQAGGGSGGERSSAPRPAVPASSGAQMGRSTSQGQLASQQQQPRLTQPLAERTDHQRTAAGDEVRRLAFLPCPPLSSRAPFPFSFVWPEFARSRASSPTKADFASPSSSFCSSSTAASHLTPVSRTSNTLPSNSSSNSSRQRRPPASHSCRR